MYYDPNYDYMSTLIIDTTTQHGHHFFDINCKVCTGKVPDPMYDEPPSTRLSRPLPQVKEEGYSDVKAMQSEIVVHEEVVSPPSAIFSLSRDPRRSKPSAATSGLTAIPPPPASVGELVVRAKISGGILPIPTYPLL